MADGKRATQFYGKINLLFDCADVGSRGSIIFVLLLITCCYYEK